MSEPASCRKFLQLELDRLQTRNPRFSLRAYARLLKLSPAHLSQVLAGRKHLSLEACDTAAAALKLNPENAKYFRLLVELDLASKDARPLLRQKASRAWTRIEAKNIALDGKLHRPEWAHFLIMVALDLRPEFDARDLRGLARFAEISESELRRYLRELESAGLVELRGDSYQRTHRQLVLAPQIKSTAISSLHRTCLQRADRHLLARKASDRFSISQAYSVPASKLAEMRERISDLLDDLAALSEEGSADHVVELAMHFNTFGRDDITG